MHTRLRLRRVLDTALRMGLRFESVSVQLKTEFCGVDWRWFQHGLISRIRRFDSYPPQPNSADLLVRVES